MTRSATCSTRGRLCAPQVWVGDVHYLRAPPISPLVGSRRKEAPGREAGICQLHRRRSVVPIMGLDGSAWPR